MVIKCNAIRYDLTKRQTRLAFNMVSTQERLSSMLGESQTVLEVFDGTPHEKEQPTECAKTHLDDFPPWQPSPKRQSPQAAIDLQEEVSKVLTQINDPIDGNSSIGANEESAQKSKEQIELEHAVATYDFDPQFAIGQAVPALLKYNPTSRNNTTWLGASKANN